ncbi:MAG: GAF and ANTAR domain-containing protein [Actinomycetes bacterium]
MEAIPEVRAAATRLAALSYETLDLVEGLEAVAGVAVAALPSVVGVSITVVVDGDPFTVTATSDEMAALDATQYIDGGPCTTAANQPETLIVDDVLDEQRWQLYAQAAAANGVRSSMSLPLRSSGEPLFGALNLYAGEPDAFRGKEAQLAELFGARVEDLVSNADLSFMTREHARELPQRLAEREQVNQAIRVLMDLHGWTAEEARERLDFAAGHAGTSRASVARVVMVLDT